MSPIEVHMALSGIEISLGFVVLVMLIRARELKSYWPMLAISTWEVIPFATLLYLQHLGPTRIDKTVAYRIYFYTFWTSFAVETVCAILLTFVLLSVAMAPLKGLKRLGVIVYYWAAAVSCMVALGVSIAPSIDSGVFAANLVSHLQRSSSIIEVCLVIFMCTAIQPLGMSFRSRVFGVSVGLIVVSVTNLLQANFFMQRRSLYGNYALVQIASNCIANLVWIYYFSVEEPKRKFILLPTTSPFLRWNQIAEMLGHHPGFVAISGVAPEVFTNAEIEIFHRASAMMHELEQKQPPPPVGSLREIGQLYDAPEQPRKDFLGL